MEQPEPDGNWNDWLATAEQTRVSDWSGNKLMYQFDNKPMYQWNSRMKIKDGMTCLLQRKARCRTIFFWWGWDVECGTRPNF